MGITPEEIDLVYQTILWRSPNPDTDYNAWQAAANNLAELVYAVGFSPEATKRRAPIWPGFCDPDLQEGILSILRKLQPHTVKGAMKTRVGREYDGGYVMIDDFAGVEVAYSFGVGDDVSWELQMAQRGIEIFLYDHTIEALPVEHPQLHWSKRGVKGNPQSSEELATLQDLLVENGHTAQSNMVLKCDIEGDEWEVIANVPKSVLNQFRQIVVEVHALDELRMADFRELAGRSITNLTAQHRVVHVHGNNCAPFAVVGGIGTPCVLELTLIRLGDHGVMPQSSEIFPTPLDMPCCKSFADYRLGTFCF